MTRDDLDYRSYFQSSASYIHLINKLRIKPAIYQSQVNTFDRSTAAIIASIPQNMRMKWILMDEHKDPRGVAVSRNKIESLHNSQVLNSEQ